jgi:Mg2+ and Co2+ transporter CorA
MQARKKEHDPYDPSEEEKQDPFDRFESSPEAARAILRSIKMDLKEHKRLREYQADFLMYSIIDKAAEQLTPIYTAYGCRLRYLQDSCFVHGSLRNVKKYCDEVRDVHMELQELRQWIGQLRQIVGHLEGDCRDFQNALKHGKDVMHNFGADSRGHGKSMLLFLGHTRDYLDLATERLKILEELAKTFMNTYAASISDFHNSVLFVLTITTVVLAPAQFLAGVYGMNFEYGMDDLKNEDGYRNFWIISASLVSLALFLVWAIMHGLHTYMYGQCCTCCRRRRPSTVSKLDHQSSQLEVNHAASSLAKSATLAFVSSLTK